MSDEVPDDKGLAKSVGITTPPSLEGFDGTATGTYAPITSPPPVITASFWKNVPSGTDPTSPADLPGVVELDTPAPGMWKAKFALPAGESGQHGYLRIVKSTAPTNPQISRDLVWPVVGLRAPIEHESKKRHAAVTPQVHIQEPSNPDEVPRFFLVYGEFNSGDGNTVSVRLFRPDDTEAVATILPTEYPYGIQWVTAVLTYEGGIGYRVQARLIDKDGNALPTPVSAGLAID